MFIIIASVLTLLGLFFLLHPLLQRGSGSSQSQRDQLNQAIYHAKVEELAEDLSKGLLDEDEYQIAVKDLQQTLVTDVTGEQYQPAVAQRMLKLALVIAISLPMIAYSLYQTLSTYETESEIQQRLIASQAQSMEAAMQSLRENLQANPQDLEGWKMLGQSHSVLEQYQQAKDVYLTALSHFNNSDPDLLVLAAEASAFANDELFGNYELDLLKRALSINPLHERALWYAGYAAFLNQDYSGSIDSWTLLLSQVPASRPEVKASLEQFLDDARERAGLEAVASNENDNQSGAREIIVDVALADGLATQTRDDEVLFVYAKAVAGPPMPLSLVKLTAADLPTRVKLTTESAMLENMNLDAFQQVEVVARISKSGQAITQTGDLISSKKQVDFAQGPRAEISLLINQIVK